MVANDNKISTRRTEGTEFTDRRWIEHVAPVVRLLITND